MPGHDDDLLARLNALKPSSVSLGASRPPVEVEISRPQTVEDHLADRLKGLRSGAVTSSPRNINADTNSNHPVPSKNSASHPAAEEKLSLADWQRHSDDDQTIEDLLAELGPEDQWKLNSDDSKAIDALLKEAKDAIPPEDKHSTADSTEINTDQTSKQSDDENSGEQNQPAEGEEADDYVKRVLAELEMDQKYGANDEEDHREDEGGHSDQGLDLPTTPSAAPQAPVLPEPPSYEDSELEARFSKLGLDLPSTPTSAPSSGIRAAGLKGRGANGSKLNAPKFTDEEIDSWCCICNEDGEVKCLGCDGDVYCQQCWSEGHGNGPGQERGHRAVQYNRRGPAAAA